MSDERTRSKQRRAIEREKAIITAAAQLLGEQGYEAASLKAVGERAGIPTASVYHYFKDRGQLEVVLIDRHLELLADQITASISAPEVASLHAVVASAIDATLRFGRRHPDFVQLWRHRPDALRERAGAFTIAQADALRRTLLAKGLIDADTPPFVVCFAYEVIDNALRGAFEHSSFEESATTAELTRMITAYLETYAPA